jgi:hypothetical protein
MFAKGNQLAKGKHHSRALKQPKTIWLLESLAQNGVNLQDLMAKSLIKAARGDKQAMELSHLLAKYLPHIANAPKSSAEVINIETLVISRYNGKEPIQPSITEPIDVEPIAERPSCYY